jgi:hypothetical protein
MSRAPITTTSRLAGSLPLNAMPALAPVVVLAAMLTSSCCAASYEPAGVSLRIAAPLAQAVHGGTVKVCWSGSCTSSALDLVESRTGGRDGSRDARDRADFVVLDDLPEEPVEVAITLHSENGKVLAEAAVSVTPEQDLCEDGPRAHVMVDADGNAHQLR